MYTSQNLRVRWEHSFSELFNVNNGVKQGGFLLNELSTTALEVEQKIFRYLVIILFIYNHY